MEPYPFVQEATNDALGKIMIPQVCHFYWGGGPLSYLQYLSVVSFKKHNPDWGVILWQPQEPSVVHPTWSTREQEDVYIGKDYLQATLDLCTTKIIDFAALGIEKLIPEVQRADIARWYLLYEYGGIWSDVDILYVKPIGELLGSHDFSFSYHITPYIGFYITKSKQPIFGELFEVTRDIVRRNMSDNYQSLGADYLTNRFGSLGAVRATYPEASVLDLPQDVVYSYRSDEVEEMFYGSEDKTTTNTIGLHWYNGSPIAKGYQNNFDKHRSNDSIISKLAREYV